MPATANYGYFARLLHRLALGSDAIAEMAMDVEALLYPPVAHGRPVFVAGLARAGTTLLMRLLYETGQFCSLTYRDMPFVLAPNLWKRLSGTRAAVAAERAHGDGLAVDYDSPEALEEVFWRVTCGRRYIFPDHLAPMTASPDVVGKFRGYVGRIVHRYRGSRYLSKNNNNILRLGAIRSAFPDAVVLVPFRHPADQARSLWQQHRHFSDMNQTDAFAGEYMTWLAHHEFGAAHRPFVWGLGAADRLDANGVDYWLEQWLGVYGHLAQQAQRVELDLILVDYDRLCADPAGCWLALSPRIGVSRALPPGLPVRPREAADQWEGDGELFRRAQALHGELTALSRQGPATRAAA